jgi:two-component system sensor histidine kinase DesK
MTCQNTHEEYDPDSAHRPWVGRLFGAIWVINLVPLVLLLIDRSVSGFTIWTALGWLALAGIAGTFLWLVLLGVPHWAPRTSREVTINRVLVASQMVVITGIIMAWPNEGFEYYLIYPAVLAGMYFPRREATRWLGFIASLFISLTFQHRQWGDLAQGTLLIVGLGINTVFWTALLEQNRQLRRARAEISRLAATDERLRIARDLHDLLGHSLSLIALKSELALRLLPDYVDRATGEVRDIEQVARTSLQEVREAVSGYRAKTLADELDGAAQMLAAAGIELRQTMQLSSLPMDIERTLAWFVREGVTNVIRHAQASRVTIALLEHRGTFTAEIEDDGQGTDPEASHGSGIDGLRERIASLGGALTVGPVPGGGFRLRAVIPPDLTGDQAPEMEPTGAGIEHTQEPVGVAP